MTDFLSCEFNLKYFGMFRGNKVPIIFITNYRSIIWTMRPSRRQLVSGIAAFLGAGGATSYALNNLTPTAMATAQGHIGDASVTSNAGRVKNVNVKITGRLNFDGLEEPAAEFRIRNYVKVEDLTNGGTVISKTQINDTGWTAFPQTPSGWGGDGEAADGGRDGYIASDVDWYIIQEDGAAPDPTGYGLPTNPVDSAPLTVDADGSRVRYKVILFARYDLRTSTGAGLTGSGTNLGVVETSGDVTLKVTNEEASTSVGGDDAEGDTADSASASAPDQD